MKPELSNRRRFPRTSAILGTAMVVVVRQNQRGRFSIEDLSASGAQLVGELILQPGERIGIVLEINEDHRLSFKAEVVRSMAEPGDRCRVGVAFCDVPTTIEDRIQKLVLSALERLWESAQRDVLVLDEDPEIRNALERDLKALGRRAFLAATPLDLVRRLQDQGRLFDVALINLRHGSADGVDVLAYLAEEHPTIHRVLMSDRINTEIRDAEVVLDTGRAQSFLAKPWTRDSLGAVLDLSTEDA